MLSVACMHVATLNIYAALFDWHRPTFLFPEISSVEVHTQLAHFTHIICIGIMCRTKAIPHIGSFVYECCLHSVFHYLLIRAGRLSFAQTRLIFVAQSKCIVIIYGISKASLSTGSFWTILKRCCLFNEYILRTIDFVRQHIILTSGCRWPP